MPRAKKDSDPSTSGFLIGGEGASPDPGDRLMQPNELTRSMYRCSGTAQKMFVTAVAAFMRNDLTRRRRWIRLKFREAISALSMPDGSATRLDFKRAVDEVADLSVVLQDDGDAWHRLNLFEEAAIDWETGEMKFKPSEKFATFLEIEHRRGYTVFSVEAVSRLHSFYAMRYFEIAMSYRGFKGRVVDEGGWAERNGVDLRNSWFFSYTPDELRRLFLLDSGRYKQTHNFVIKVVSSPIAELNAKIHGYRFRVQVRRRNNMPHGKILGFVFWVTESEDGACEVGACEGPLPEKRAGPEEPPRPEEASRPEGTPKPRKTPRPSRPQKPLRPTKAAEAAASKPDAPPDPAAFDATLDFMERMRRAHGEEFAGRLAERLAAKKPYELELLLSVEVAFSMYTDGYRP